MNIFIKGKEEHGIVHDGEKTLLFSYSGYSDNQCEWLSLIDALKWISGTHEFTGYTVLTDSLLLYRQLIGENRIKSKALKPLYFVWNQLKNILYELEMKYDYVLPEENPAREEYEKCYN
jgi:ribonuclease HI